MHEIDLGVRPTDRSDLRAWYSAALGDQVKSGLSVKDYAVRLGVNATTLYEWRRRLGPTGNWESNPRAHWRLVEVTMTTWPSAVSGALVLRIGDGRRSIEVPRGFDDDDLRRLIAVLESC